MTSESEKAIRDDGAQANPPEVTGFAPLADLIIGFMFMTRLPTPAWRNRPLAKAVWTFPIVGLVIGLIGGGVFWGAYLLFVNSWISALLALGAMAFATGALHEDGFSDAADGLWGGHDREKRITIMRDSNIGGYGALALVINVGLRAGALATLADPMLVLPVLVIAHSLSRSFVALVMGGMDTASRTGLAAAAGRPPPASVLMAAILGLGLFLAMTPFAVPTLGAIHLIVWPALSVLIFMKLVQAKIGGYNGDTLGATQQISETAILLAMVAVKNQGF